MRTFGVRRENSRYLTGFVLADGEEKVAGHSGQFLVGRDEVIVLADSRYEIPGPPGGARDADRRRGLRPAGSVAGLVESLGAKRVAVEAGFVPFAVWRRLEAAAPDVELVPVEGWVEADRATKDPSELERVAAACAVADRALATLLPRIVPGVSEKALALELEWLLRTGGAETIAFDPTCLVGPAAAMPHGSPSDAVVETGRVVLFDFGRQVDGYRSDMTRTLFCGEPTERDLGVYELVAAAQTAVIDQLAAALGAEIELPSGRDLDAVARGVIDADGRWPAYRHGLGHGSGSPRTRAPR
jgi:Xaa-Pro aminopeptidase/Xaa-Pro dipeptidase